jgi:hypothetical protein
MLRFVLDERALPGKVLLFPLVELRNVSSGGFYGKTDVRGGVK